MSNIQHCKDYKLPLAPVQNLVVAMNLKYQQDMVLLGHPTLELLVDTYTTFKPRWWTIHSGQLKISKDAMNVPLCRGRVERPPQIVETGWPKVSRVCILHGFFMKSSIPKKATCQKFMANCLWFACRFILKNQNHLLQASVVVCFCYFLFTLFVKL